MSTVWLQPRDLEVGGSAGWRLGPRHLWVQRAAKEWTVATEAGEWDDERTDATTVGSEAPPETDSQRFVFDATDAQVELRPALAGRPVVSAPRVPLFVPPGESARLYVGSPLWIRIEVGAEGSMLWEIPVRRPSDTWFGAITGAGELCYSTRTRAALDPANAPASAIAAVTPVLVRNLADETLPIDKLKLPVPYLPLYLAGSRLWTASVTLQHHAGNHEAALDILDGPPPEAVDATLVTPARERPDPGLLIGAFGGLLQSVLPGDRE